MAIEIKVPDIGADEVEITEILVKVGDKVEAEQSLITVEGDKASMEVPSPQAGVVKEIKVSVGDKTETGKLIMIFDSAEVQQPLHLRRKRRKKPLRPLLRQPPPRQRKKCTSRISAAMKLKSPRSWLKWAIPSPLSNP